jgi:hypothetical protein
VATHLAVGLAIVLTMHSILFDQAFKNFELQPYYKPELARTCFKKAKFLESLGDEADSRTMMIKAEALYLELVPSAKSQSMSLTAQDFDNIVAIWAR